jgi:hypothetical protein
MTQQITTKSDVAPAPRTAYATPAENIGKAIDLLNYLPNGVAAWVEAHDGNQELAEANGEQIKQLVNQLGAILASMPRSAVYNVYGVGDKTLTFSSSAELNAAMAGMGIKHVGYSSRTSRLRPELKGQPTFTSLNGPMYDGGGKIRYEGRGVGTMY